MKASRLFCGNNLKPTNQQSIQRTFVGSRTQRSRLFIYIYHKHTFASRLPMAQLFGCCRCCAGAASVSLASHVNKLCSISYALRQQQQQRQQQPQPQQEQEQQSHSADDSDVGGDCDCDRNDSDYEHDDNNNNNKQSKQPDNIARKLRPNR